MFECQQPEYSSVVTAEIKFKEVSETDNNSGFTSINVEPAWWKLFGLLVCFGVFVCLVGLVLQMGNHN